MRNKQTLRIAGLSLCTVFGAALGGCSGQYVLTVGDQIAPTGGAAAVVVRLQQYEFATHKRSLQDMPVRFRIDDGPERAAFTDELGFAGVSLAAGKTEGKKRLLVSLQTASGDEVSTEAPLYVWNKNSPIVAVDLDSLPDKADPQAPHAAKALGKLSADTHILYLTRQSPYRKARIRAKVAALGYPDGPILLWRWKDWHFVRTGRLRLYWIVIEANLASRVSYLTKLMGNFRAALCGSAETADVFLRAGITPVIIGNKRPAPAGLTAYRSWADAAAKGISY
ncbi:MAG: hypothetical protein J7M14_02100 [Planctomycetes bacterium]|nr:hypothetical protein [Planctomycetota bacterium]